MAKEYSKRLFPIISDVDLNALIETKKENGININSDSDLYFKKDKN